MAKMMLTRRCLQIFTPPRLSSPPRKSEQSRCSALDSGRKSLEKCIYLCPMCNHLAIIFQAYLSIYNIRKTIDCSSFSLVYKH